MVGYPRRAGGGIPEVDPPESYAPADTRADIRVDTRADTKCQRTLGSPDETSMIE